MVCIVVVGAVYCVTGVTVLLVLVLPLVFRFVPIAKVLPWLELVGVVVKAPNSQSDAEVPDIPCTALAALGSMLTRLGVVLCKVVCSWVCAALA